MQNLKNTLSFLFLRLIIIVAHIKITIKITVQSSNSNPAATDDTSITTIIVFTGVWMIDDTSESTDGLSAEIIATIISVEIKGRQEA